MGSPSQEPNREPIEGPRARVSVEPFWMGKYEVTWDEYEPFMVTQVDRSKDGARTDYDPARHGVVDAVTQPTPPYIEMSFGMGQSGYPAISMTQHAANKYCQWLSAIEVDSKPAHRPTPRWDPPCGLLKVRFLNIGPKSLNGVTFFKNRWRSYTK